jgi:hypothetical protein
MGELRIEIPERVMLGELRKLATLKLFDELFKHSELTGDDCLKLGKEVNKAVRLRIEKELIKVFSTADFVSLLS